ncbi:MAG: hypothetical protein O7A04_12595 [Acidobacteria bacterium]|nr:hypothetical protein [Acidobacteriota bacterium]
MNEVEGRSSEAMPTSDESSPQESGVLLAVAPLLAWLVPGAGHFLLGKRGRAVAFCAIVFFCAVIGCQLEGRLDTINDNDPLSVIATLASLGSGAIYLVLKLVVGYEGNIVAAGFEYGTTFLRTAGILNLLLVLDALDIARGRKS